MFSILILVAIKDWWASLNTVSVILTFAIQHFLLFFIAGMQMSSTGFGFTLHKISR